MPLNIIKSEDGGSRATEARRAPRQNRTDILRAQMDRQWLLAPEKLDPSTDCSGLERIKRAQEILTRHLNLHQKRVLDIGCGIGTLSRFLRDAGSTVTAVDISANALKKLHKVDSRDIEVRQDALPNTALQDKAYDLIVCTEVIAELNTEHHRLTLSELRRLTPKEGHLLCSTAVDTHSENAVQLFLQLVLTEYDIVEVLASHHLLHLRLKNLFGLPAKYCRAWNDPAYRLRQIEKRSGFHRWWFKVNSSLKTLAKGWKFASYCCAPSVRAFKHGRGLLLFLEKVTRLVWGNKGITHITLLAAPRLIQ